MDDVSSPTVSPAVEQAARDHDLGSLLNVRKLTHPLVSAAGSLIAALIALGLFALLGKGIEALDEDYLPRWLEKSIGFVALFLLVFGCGFVITAVVTLVRGSRSYYLWEAGFAYKHNRQVRAYPWTEVHEVLLQRFETGEDIGKIYQYRVVPETGRPIAVPVVLTDGHDPFNEALADAVRAAGRPVT